jgi:zinc transporter ZupT
MHLPLLTQIVLACLLGGLLSVAGAALVMFGLPKKWLGFTVSFSTGLLLATATLHLLPEALESGLAPREVFPLLLGGILAFFILEKYALWRHAHASGESTCTRAGSSATTTPTATTTCTEPPAARARPCPSWSATASTTSPTAS